MLSSAATISLSDREDVTSEGVPCPICREETAAAGAKFGNFARRDFHFRHCPHCRFSFVADPWTDYAAIYDDRYYRGGGADPYVDYHFELKHPEEAVRRYEWQGILTAVSAVRPLTADTRWLDFGCGNGGQVRHVAAQQVCEIAGTDTGAIVGEAQSHGIRILEDAELESWAGTCDIVTAIEVLEHCADPLAVLRQIRTLLKPGGLFFFTTGDARRFRGRLPAWSYAIPEVHVSFFEPETLARALVATGFRPEFRENLPGFDEITRFKGLKRIGLRRRSRLESLLPWSLLIPWLRERVGIGAHPIGWAV